MKLINKKTYFEGDEKVTDYYYDNLGGFEGMANVLREYENLGYEIKYIKVTVNSDHSDPYLNPTTFSNIDEFQNNIFLFPEDTNSILSRLRKDIDDYVIVMGKNDNSVSLHQEIKKKEEIDEVDEIKKIGSK